MLSVFKWGFSPWDFQRWFFYLALSKTFLALKSGLTQKRNKWKGNEKWKRVKKGPKMPNDLKQRCFLHSWWTRNFIYLLLMNSRGAETHQVPRWWGPTTMLKLRFVLQWIMALQGSSSPICRGSAAFPYSLFPCERSKSPICRGLFPHQLWQGLWQC